MSAAGSDHKAKHAVRSKRDPRTARPLTDCVVIVCEDPVGLVWRSEYADRRSAKTKARKRAKR